MKTFPLFLVSSNDTKYHHLRFLSDRLGITLYHIRRQYVEVQTHRLSEQLRHAMILLRRSSRGLDRLPICIEQTGVFLQAFQGPGGKAGPGYYFKDWWAERGKRELLDMASEFPEARVVSGVALNLPSGPTAIFTTAVYGRIDVRGGDNLRNRPYPWLSEDNFNRYFVPNGADRPFNAMDIEESLQYDFRLRNMKKVALRMREYTAAINLDVAEVERAARRFTDRHEVPKPAGLEYFGR